MSNSRAVGGGLIILGYDTIFSDYMNKQSFPNRHFKSISEFNGYYEQYPLAAQKIVIFQSSISDRNTIREFSNFILDESSQVGQLLFIVDAVYRDYFEEMLIGHDDKKFLQPGITFRAIEAEVTGTKGFKLNTPLKMGRVIQKRSDQDLKDSIIDRDPTKISLVRSEGKQDKRERERSILDREIQLEGEKYKEGMAVHRDFFYIGKRPIAGHRVDRVLLNDSGENVYNMIRSDYSQGRRMLFIDNTDSMLFSFLIEKDNNLPKSIMLDEIYMEGPQNPMIAEYFNNNGLAFVRNTYRVKSNLEDIEIQNLIDFLVGYYGDLYDTVYVLTDDLKQTGVNKLRYVLLPATLDNLMKFINYEGRRDVSERSNTYVKLIQPEITNKHMINEAILKKYLKDNDLTNIISINGRYNLNKVHETYLFDIVDVETGEDPDEINVMYIEEKSKGLFGRRKS